MGEELRSAIADCTEHWLSPPSASVLRMMGV